MLIGICGGGGGSSKFFSIHAVFGKNDENIRLAPPFGNPGSAIDAAYKAECVLR